MPTKSQGPQIDFTTDSLRLFYNMYREYIVPSIIMVFCLLLFFFFLLPQFNEYLAMQKEADATRVRIDGIKKNITFLQNLDVGQTDSDFQTVSVALPSEKDFVGVLEAVSKSSTNSQVSVGDFSFLVGDLSTKSAQLSDRPTLSLSLNVNGSIDSIKEFIKQLSLASPIAEVSTLSINQGSAAMNVAFYYKVIPKQLSVEYDAPLPSPSSTQRKLIDSLSLWQTSTQTASSASFVSF